MRHLYLSAAALALALCQTAWCADYEIKASEERAQVEVTDVAADQMVADQAAAPTFDEWYAANGAMDVPLRVMGLLTKAQVAEMRAAHAANGLALDLSIVPAGGINAGKYYVSGTLAPEMLAAMHAAHDTAQLALDLRAMPVAPAGVVMGYSDAREMHGEGDMAGMDSDDIEYGERVGGPDNLSPGEWRDTHERMEHRGRGGGWHKGMRGDWHGQRRWHGKRGWKGHGGWRGGARWYDRGCGHWENDWHQDGCGSVHVHNLADWLPGRPGWGYGYPYGGWDDDFWPHVRGDGSHVWYTGEFWRNANFKVEAPAWYDAQWAMFADAYPDTFWVSSWQGYSWAGHGGWHGGCGCGGCKSVKRCGGCHKWKCGCGHHKCGCR